MNRSFEKLTAVARLQDEWAESSNLGVQVRQRLFSDRVAIRALPRSRAVIWLGAGCAAASMAAAAAWLLMPLHSELTFSVGQDLQRGSIGKWVSATASALPLKFSDGTQIILRKSAQARVTELQARGAHVVLERGELAAAVRHQQGTHWELQAGPFSVLVRGTQFNLGWTPESSSFALQLTEGVVDVTGPGLVGPRTVQAGQTLHVSAMAGGWKVDDATNPVAPAVSESDSIDTHVTNTAEVAAPEVTPINSTTQKAVNTSAPGWQELATAGNYADSMVAARKLGLQRIYTTGSANELTKLAQVARFAGDADSARAALRALRERFAGSAEAAMATFDLGRLSFDTSGRYLEAAHWFKDYLREFPHGNLAREAMGRLIESLERGGDHTGAREAASEYLLRFPSGPHAGLARRVLNR